MTASWHSRAIAHINHGAWKADCPRPGCGNAVGLQPKQSTFYCTDRTGEGSCGLRADVEWPPDADELFEELARRPVRSTRNWAPAGHWQALGQVRTQTANDLREEFAVFDPTSSALLELAGEYVDCVQLGPGLMRALESGQTKLIGGGSN